MSKIMFMLFDERVVSVGPIDRKMFDLLQRDARRILGESPAKDGGYLECARVGSAAYQYAQRMLAAQFPAAFVSTIPPNLSVCRRLVSMERLHRFHKDVHEQRKILP